MSQLRKLKEHAPAACRLCWRLHGKMPVPARNKREKEKDSVCVCLCERERDGYKANREVVWQRERERTKERACLPLFFAFFASPYTPVRLVASQNEPFPFSVFFSFPCCFHFLPPYRLIMVALTTTISSRNASGIWKCSVQTRSSDKSPLAIALCSKWQWWCDTRGKTRCHG